MRWAAFLSNGGAPGEWVALPLLQPDCVRRCSGGGLSGWLFVLHALVLTGGEETHKTNQLHNLHNTISTFVCVYMQYYIWHDLCPLCIILRMITIINNILDTELVNFNNAIYSGVHLFICSLFMLYTYNIVRILLLISSSIWLTCNNFYDLLNQ